MARSGSPDARSLAASAAVFGRKWHPMVLRLLLEDGPLGFADLEAELGVSRKVLAESLEDLQAKHVVERTVVTEAPTRVEYSLTERGRALEEAVEALHRWGETYLRETDGLEPPIH